MKNLWKGIAICGIWAATAYCIINIEIGNTIAPLLLGFFFACFATAAIANSD